MTSHLFRHRKRKPFANVYGPRSLYACILKRGWYAGPIVWDDDNYTRCTFNLYGQGRKRAEVVLKNEEE